MLILFYRLGIGNSIKMILTQFQTKKNVMQALNKLEQRFKDVPEKDRYKLKKELKVKRDEVSLSIRHCTW